MDYFQGVVAEYLRANRQTFVNPEFFLQLNKDEKMPTKGTSWYVDMLAVNFRKHTVHLCEVTYSQSLNALLGRLSCLVKKLVTRCWLCSNVMRLCRQIGWYEPWIFIPENYDQDVCPNSAKNTEDFRLSP